MPTEIPRIGMQVAHVLPSLWSILFIFHLFVGDQPFGTAIASDVSADAVNLLQRSAVTIEGSREQSNVVIDVGTVFQQYESSHGASSKSTLAKSSPLPFGAMTSAEALQSFPSAPQRHMTLILEPEISTGDVGFNASNNIKLLQLREPFPDRAGRNLILELSKSPSVKPIPHGSSRTAFGEHSHVSNTLVFFNLVAMFCGVLHFVCGVGVTEDRGTLAIGTRSADTRDASEKGGQTIVGQAGATAPIAATRAPSAKLAYFDNLKITLSFLVLFQHTLRCFSVGKSFYFNVSLNRGSADPRGYAIDNFFAAVFVPWVENINESFFMVILFLISGYFTPTSFDRKGRYAFLKDKFQRLGVPCLFWHFVMGPVWAYEKISLTMSPGNFIDWYLKTYDGLWYQIGPPWFLIWLLNFNVFYAYCDGAPVIWAPPSIAAVLWVAFAFGLFQMVVPIGLFFIECPGGMHTLPLYAVFFSFGVLAKRGRWFEAIKAFDSSSIWFLRMLALANIGVLYAAAASMKSLYVTGSLRDDAYESMESIVHFFMGFNCVIMSLVLIEFCQSYWTTQGFLLWWMGQGRYTVYLIHPFFIVLGVALYAKVLKLADVDVEIYDGPGPPGYIINSNNQWFLPLGFLFVMTFNLIIWPVAYAIAKMPVLRNFL